MIAARKDFADRAALAKALAGDVAGHLPGRLAVSGGNTPKLLFRELSKLPADWAHTTITLVDERQVPETSERSNARLVRENLLQNAAAKAVFEPLTPTSAAKPFSAVILGMGSDGHTASFFPHGDHLAVAIDPRAPAGVITMIAPGAGEPRLTYTLSALLQTDFLALHIEGEDKARVLEEALKDGPTTEMPIRTVLRSAMPLTVYWSP